MNYTHDLIVVGGGAAGLTVASGAAQLGVKVALVERERLGGDCLYHGCVPSKSLLRSAGVYALAKETERFGLPRAEIGRPDLGTVMERVGAVVSSIARHDSPERFTALGAEVIFGEPRFVSPCEIDTGRGSGKLISAPKIILATGSSPRAVPIPGLEQTGYITNRDIFSLTTLPESLAVIGAGPIGVEMSHAFARLGSRVLLLDVAEEILPREDADMAGVVRRRLEADGVRIATGASISRVSGAGSGKTLSFSVGGEEETFRADRILLAVGRTGNIDGLGLEEAGVATERGFVTVDAKLRSSSRHIMAIGDLNGRYLFTHVAGAEGSFAVRRAVLHVPGEMDYDRVPWVTYTDPELASIGYNEVRAREAGIEYELAESSFAENDRAHAEGETEGKVKILTDGKGKLIGTQIVGPHAGELLGPHLIAFAKGLKLMDIMGPIYPYPTLGEASRRAAGNVLGPRLFNGRVRALLRLLFRYHGEGPAPGAR